MLTLSGGCASRAASSSVPSQIDGLFTNWIKPDAPGCSVGVSRNGTTIYERGYGIANLDLAVHISPASVFPAGSVSKPFTAMAVLMLASRGQLSLDDAVAKYVPEWGAREHPITIRHLLQHTSGLRDAFVLQGLRPEHPEDINQQIVSILAHARGFNFVPGSRFEYNNGAYTLLASIVERVSRQRFAAFVDANIFAPLGMTHSHFHDDATEVVANRAAGYVPTANGFRLALRTYTVVVVGNDGLVTNVDDLLRWEQNFVDGRVGGAGVLHDMQTPVMATGWSTTSQYGYGLEVDRYRGLQTIGHGGSDDGIRSYVVRYPERGVAIAILCNRDDVDTAALSRSILDRILEGTFPEQAVAPSGASNTRPVSVPLETLRQYVGMYRTLSDDTVAPILLRDDRLIAKTPDGAEFELTPVASNRFVIVGTPVVAEFVPRSGDRPQELRVTGTTAGNAPVISHQVESYVPSDAERRAFEGTYTSGEVDGTYVIASSDSGLVLRVPTRAEVELRPVFKDAFYGAMLGTIRFSRDATGRVTGFTSSAPSVRGLHFDRRDRQS